MVGGFIQKQQIWLHKEGSGEGNAHPPTPGECPSASYLHRQCQYMSFILICITLPDGIGDCISGGDGSGDGDNCSRDDGLVLTMGCFCRRARATMSA